MPNLTYKPKLFNIEKKYNSISFLVQKEYPVFLCLVGVFFSQCLCSKLGFPLIEVGILLFSYYLPLKLKFTKSLYQGVLSGFRLGLLSILIFSRFDLALVASNQIKIISKPRILNDGRASLSIIDSKGKKFHCNAKVSPSANILTIKKNQFVEAKISKNSNFCTVQYITKNYSKGSDLTKLSEHIEKAIEKHFSGEVAGILSSMLLGNLNSITRQTKDLFKHYGIYHFLVVSGFHVALVYSLCTIFVNIFLFSVEF